MSQPPIPEGPSPITRVTRRTARLTGSIVPCLGVACLLTGSSPAIAAQSWKTCLEAAVVEADLRACARERLDRAEAALDETYRRLSDHLGPDRRELLEEAQRRWADYRDAHCGYVAAPLVGASLHHNVMDTCRARLTEHRTEQLAAATDAASGGDAEAHRSGRDPEHEEGGG